MNPNSPPSTYNNNNNSNNFTGNNNFNSMNMRKNQTPPCECCSEGARRPSVVYLLFPFSFLFFPFNFYFIDNLVFNFFVSIIVYCSCILVIFILTNYIYCENCSGHFCHDCDLRFHPSHSLVMRYFLSTFYYHK